MKFLKRTIFLLILVLIISGCSYDAPATTHDSNFDIEVPAVTSVLDTKVETKTNLNLNTYKATSTKKVTQPSAPRGYYENVDGISVPRPYVAPSRPAGASAKCRDGTYSFSLNRRGTCSHHGGVAVWY